MAMLALGLLVNMPPVLFGEPIINNPLVYWSLVSEPLWGPNEYTFSKEEAFRTTRRFMDKVVDTNKASVTASVGVVVGAFEASVSTSFEKAVENTQEHMEEEEQSVINKMSQSIKFGEDRIYLVAHEMKMFVYKTDNQTVERLIVPTTPHTGAMGIKSLENQLLDDSFTSIANRFGLKIHSLSELENMIPEDKILTLEPVPREGVYYQIKSKLFPRRYLRHLGMNIIDNEGDRFDTYSLCFDWDYARERFNHFQPKLPTPLKNKDGEHHRFEKVDDTENIYRIYTKRDFMMMDNEDAPEEDNQPDGTFDEDHMVLHQKFGKLTGYTEFRVVSLGNGLVKIQNRLTNRWLAMAEDDDGEGVCGFFRNPDSSDNDDVWELVRAPST